MNLKIASAKCMRNLSERNKPVVLHNELDKIQELINIAAAKAETECCLSPCPCEEIVNALIKAGYEIEVFVDTMTIKW